VLKIVAKLPVEFYLTGGTALSRAYLNHRYSDDLDFFVNNAGNFKIQVNKVIKAITESGFSFNTTVADEGYARMFVFDGEHALKLDFVNDVSFRSGTPEVTKLFERTDNLNNILSNKVTALGRYSPKDVVDIVYIREILSFNWENILNDASEKDLWVNPINVAEVLEQFPMEKLQEVAWLGEAPSSEWFTDRVKQVITGIINGSENTPNN
jgi:predicted nucleotidyltransferase component of viral defense system